MSKKIPNINSRDFSTILGVNPYQTPFQLLEDKIEHKYPFFGNKFTEHGNRYEKTAIDHYEIETGNKVDSNQKNFSHPEYSWITGRMDGITIINNDIDENTTTLSRKRKMNNTNRSIKKRKLNNGDAQTQEQEVDNTFIIEIKCPLKADRTEPLTIDNIPKYYWTQIQVYMNMIDCNNSHYVEYYIKPDEPQESGILHYITVKRDRKWWDESLPKIKKFYEEMKKYCELGSLETHPVRQIEKEWQAKLNIV